MHYQSLVNLDPQPSVFCLGAGHYGSQLSEPSCFELLDRFADAGGNFVDTAHVYGAWDMGGANGGYGNSETVIGRWMRQRNCRDKMVIGTKGGHPDFETGASCINRETVLLNSGLLEKFGSELNLCNRRTACELAKKKGCSANQIALAWLLCQPFPVFPLIGPRTVEQLDDSLGALSVELSDEEISRFI